MRKILVVDDSKFIQALVRDSLMNKVNAEVITTASYKETKEIMKDHEFHLAIIDIILPDAQQGEVINFVSTYDIPIVVLTGGINEKTKEIILQKDILEYVIKSNPNTIDYIASIALRVLTNYDTHILVVDDSISSRQLLRMHLESMKLNVHEASNGREALDYIDKSTEKISLVMTDYNMPEIDGMELTMQLRQKFSKDHLSIIAISHSLMSVGIDFLRHGANDFIQKPFEFKEISVRINANLELIDMFKKNRDLANRDYMTGMYNRRYFFEHSESIFSKAKRNKTPLHVIMLDIDHFKSVNDTYGHDVGDLAIKEVATILNNNLRVNDTISRFGGEEFCVLIEDMTIKETQEKFEEIRRIFEKNVIKVDEEISFSYTVSIGICHGISNTIEEMIKCSDEALYVAKDTGRNKLEIKRIRA